MADEEKKTPSKKKLDEDKTLKPIMKESKKSVRSAGGGTVIGKVAMIDDPDEDITKVPVAKLRMASSIAIESSVDDVIAVGGYNKEGKYTRDGAYTKDGIHIKDLETGGYSKDKQRRLTQILSQKMKEEKRQSKISKKEKAILDKIIAEQRRMEEEELEDPTAKTVRKKVKLLEDIDYETVDKTDFVFYQNPKTRVYLIFVFILTEAFGVAFLTLVPIYSILESGNIELYLTRGYRRQGKTIHFTMGALYVFIMGNGFIMFRITSAYKGTVLKWIHALLYTCSIPIPLYCVNSYYLIKTENRNIVIQEHYYSLHSFFGFMAIYFHIFEVCCGTIVYTIFLFRNAHRNIYYQVHTYVGLLGFLLAISTFCLGITMEAYDISVSVSAPHENVLFYLNLSGIFVCVFAAFALFLIINPDFDVEKDIVTYTTTTKKDKVRKPKK